MFNWGDFSGDLGWINSVEGRLATNIIFVLSSVITRCPTMATGPLLWAIRRICEMTVPTARKTVHTKQTECYSQQQYHTNNKKHSENA